MVSICLGLLTFINVADEETYKHVLTLDKAPRKEDGVESIGWREEEVRRRELVAQIVQDANVKLVGKAQREC